MKSIGDIDDRMSRVKQRNAEREKVYDALLRC